MSLKLRSAFLTLLLQIIVIEYVNCVKCYPNVRKNKPKKIGVDYAHTSGFRNGRALVAAKNKPVSIIGDIN